MGLEGLTQELYSGDSIRDSNKGEIGRYITNFVKVLTYPIVHPIKSSTYVLNKLNTKSGVVGNWVVANGFDAFSTLDAINKNFEGNPTDFEGNPIVRWSMESFGNNEGMAFIKGVSMPISLAGLYFGGKLAGHFYEKHKTLRGKSITPENREHFENAVRNILIIPFYYTPFLWIVYKLFYE